MSRNNTSPVAIAEPEATDLWLDEGSESTVGAARNRKWLFGAIGAAVLIAGAVAWRMMAQPAAAAFGTVRVTRGDLAKTITATGKVQALTTVQVGTQVSGIISELHADFNNQVTKGQVIARLDPSQFEAQMTQARANLQSARARVAAAQNGVLSADSAVEAAQANVARNDAAVTDAERNYKLTQDLVDAGVRAAMELPSAQSAVALATAQRQQAVAQLNQAKAQSQTARSQLDQARAEADQAQASVDVATVNLDRTVIRAPIDGVVISRNVDIGQTVAASLQAPTVFLIANDLTRMQVLADIDEADVGVLRPESKVTFTVDAFPEDTFEGRISQIRLAPQAVQNVVTYTAVVDVANPDLKLKPGMTANITATVAEKKDVLQVPNSALRFRPERGGKTVWQVNGDQLTAVRVQTGMTDGINTEIISTDLKEGDRIAVAAQSNNTKRGAQQKTTSPMMPSAPRGGRIR